VLLGCVKSDAASSPGEGRPLARQQGQQPRQCRAGAAPGSPGQAAARPPAPPRLGTGQEAWACFLAPVSNATENSPAVQLGVRSQGLMGKSIKGPHRVISSGGNTLHHLFPFPLRKIRRYLSFTCREQGHYRIQLKGLPIRMTDNDGVYLKLEAKPQEEKAVSV